MRAPAFLFAAALFSAGPAFAGPIADFNAEMAAVYAQYRMVLFKTNQGDQPASAKLAGDFAGGWKALGEHWRATPPPHLSEDAEWGKTLDDVAALAGKAGEEIGAGKLPEAHETLEAVRAAVSQLNARNGLVTFSDRMNDYHAFMEHVLSAKYEGDGANAQAGADAAVLGYLAAQMKAKAPAAYVGDAEFVKAVDGIAASVDAFAKAALAGDAAAVKAAQGGLKKPYAMAFVKFG